MVHLAFTYTAPLYAISRLTLPSQVWAGDVKNFHDLPQSG